jgi:hypothetical protein
MNRRKLLAITAVWWLVMMAHSSSASDFVPPSDGYDWLRLTSGEWLRGELIGVFNDEVEFDSDILDELTIDGEDVDRFHSPRTFGLSIREQEIVTGRVWLNGDRFTVLVGEIEQEFPRSELIAITVSAERERDRWSGDLGLSVNVRQGNSEFIEYNTIAGIERRTPVSRTFVDYIGNFNEAEGVEIANNHRISGVLDRFSGSRFFWRPLNGQYFRDPFQNIKHQGTLETGLGYELIDTSKTEWDISAGAGYNYVERVSVEEGQPKNSTSPTLSLGTSFDTELTPWMDYLFSFTATFVDEESGSYQHHLLTTLSSDLAGDFDIDISFIWDRTQEPPPLADGTFPEQDDFRLLVGISYEF